MQIDPDKIKNTLPDMPGYVRENRLMAGSLTHKESGYIAEIVEREAMLQRKPVLVDGSLRNAEWFAAKFDRFRQEFPHYRIAILLIQASPESVHERASRRGAVTGREVPVVVLDAAIDAVPRSFAALEPLVDLSAVIRNDANGHAPVFQPPSSMEALAAAFGDIARTPLADDVSSCRVRHSSTEDEGTLAVGGGAGAAVDGRGGVGSAHP